MTALPSPRRAEREASLDGLSLDAIIHTSLELRGEDIAIRPETRPNAHRTAAMNFRALDRKVGRLAGLLAGLGTQVGEAALIAAPLGGEAAIALLACLRAGLSPVFAPPQADAGTLATLIERHRAPVALGVAELGELRPAGALRDAASRSLHVRLIGGFGATPDGVSALDAVLEDDGPSLPARTAPRQAHIVAAAPARGGEAFEEATLMEASLQVARVLRPAPGSRIVTTLTGCDLVSCASSMGAALLAGLEFAPIGLFGLGKLWASLSDGAPVHLVIPAAVEAALEQSGLTRHRALASLVVVHDRAPPPSACSAPTDGRAAIIVDLYAEADGEVIAERR